MKDKLLKKIENKEAHLVVVGMGYVGLPLAVEFTRAGFKVTGLEVDQEKVDLLNSGKSYIPDISSDRLAPLVAQGSLSATTDADILTMADAVSISVP
ncbi:MAG: UDP-N-acetyl-D-glucosamine dehydrogenase, partial [Chloroflexota bacterium]